MSKSTSTSPPAVLILSNNRGFGGAETSLETILPSVAGSMRAIVLAENGTHLQQLHRLALQMPLSVEKLPSGRSPAVMLRQVLLAARAVLRHRPHAIVANSHKGAVLLLALAWARVPLPPNILVLVRDFDYYTLGRLLRRFPAAVFAAPSAAVWDDNRYKAAGLMRDGVRRIIIPEALAAGGEPQDAVTAEQDSICCVCRVVPWKGLHLLLQAMSRLRAVEPQLRLRIVGAVVDEDYRRDLQALIERERLHSTVQFTAFTSELNESYARSRFIVIPSVGDRPGPETFCRVILEAWARKRAVVAFDVGGPRHVIHHGQDGLLVPEGDIEALAAAILRLWRDPMEAARLGAAGRRRLQNEFQPARAADQFLQALGSSPAIDLHRGASPQG